TASVAPRPPNRRERRVIPNHSRLERPSTPRTTPRGAVGLSRAAHLAIVRASQAEHPARRGPYHRGPIQDVLAIPVPILRRGIRMRVRRPYTAIAPLPPSPYPHPYRQPYPVLECVFSSAPLPCQMSDALTARSRRREPLTLREIKQS